MVCVKQQMFYTWPQMVLSVRIVCMSCSLVVKLMLKLFLGTLERPFGQLSQERSLVAPKQIQAEGKFIK